MELPNRQQLENQLARRLERLNARQRRKLKSYLGNPPNFDNVPESFWQEVERETEAETLAAFYLLFMASATHHVELDEPEISAELRRSLDVRATEYARTRSREFSQAYTRGLQNRVEAIPGKVIRQRGTGDAEAPPETFAIDQEELDRQIAEAMGPNQSSQAATNETTAAQSAGGEAGIEHTVGISQDDLWINRPELSRTGPCPTCKPLHMTPRSYWGKLFPAGPGREVHDGCVCTIAYRNSGKFADGLDAAGKTAA